MYRIGTLIVASFVSSLSMVTTGMAHDPAHSPKGLWTNEKQTVAVHIESCADENNLCGRIVWLKKPYHRDGSLKRDHYNPKPELRDQGLCNLEILKGFSEYGENRWENGRIYNPEEGQTYRASLELVSGDEMRVRGYVLLPVFGKTQVWQRLATAPGECPAGSDEISSIASGE